LSGEGLSSRLDAVRRARHSDRCRRARDHFEITEKTRADIAGQFNKAAIRVNSGNQPSTQGEIEPQSEFSSAGNHHPPTARTCPTSHHSSSLASTADSTSGRDLSVDFDTMQPGAEFDWVENLLDFVATSGKPETLVRSRDGSSSTASTPLERDIDLGTDAETTKHSNSQASENERRDDINGFATSSARTSQCQEDSSSSHHHRHRQHSRHIFSTLRTSPVVCQHF
jgi:hypothetical protein